jgi:glutamate decarboxylase
MARRPRTARRPGVQSQLPRRTDARPGSQVIAQYYNFLRLGRDVASGLADRIAELDPFRLLTDGRQLPVFAFTTADHNPGFNIFDVSAALREQGWLVPAYTFPANRQDLAVLPIVVRNGFSHDLSDLLIDALHRPCPRIEHQHHSQHGPETASFSHGAETTTTQNQHTYQHPTNHDQ